MESASLRLAPCGVSCANKGQVGSTFHLACLQWDNLPSPDHCSLQTDAVWGPRSLPPRRTRRRGSGWAQARGPAGPPRPPVRGRRSGNISPPLLCDGTAGAYPRTCPFSTLFPETVSHFFLDLCGANDNDGEGASGPAAATHRARPRVTCWTYVPLTFPTRLASEGRSLPVRVKNRAPETSRGSHEAWAALGRAQTAFSCVFPASGNIPDFC